MYVCIHLYIYFIMDSWFFILRVIILLAHLFNYSNYYHSLIWKPFPMHWIFYFSIHSSFSGLDTVVYYFTTLLQTSQNSSSCISFLGHSSVKSTGLNDFYLFSLCWISEQTCVLKNTQGTGWKYDKLILTKQKWTSKFLKNPAKFL